MKENDKKETTQSKAKDDDWILVQLKKKKKKKTEGTVLVGVATVKRIRKNTRTVIIARQSWQGNYKCRWDDHLVRI